MAARTTARKPARKSGKGEHKSVFEIVTEKILAELEAGTAPWHKPWASGGLPLRMNKHTKKNDTPYRGINNILLNMAGAVAGYRSPFWGTYDEIAGRSGMVKIPDNSKKGFHWESPDNTDRGVRKGEKSTLVVFWTRTRHTETDPDTGDETERRGQMLRYYTVFNAEQAHTEYLPAEFLPTGETAPGAGNSVVEEAEAIIRRYLENNGPDLSHADPFRAFYNSVTDHINVPPLDQFEDPNEFYSTAFHELGHSTGHKDRLNRKELVAMCVFGSSTYSKEELCAEMTCAFLCAFAGVNTPEVTSNSAAYLAGWVRKLRGEPKLVVQAAAQAQHAVDLIMGVSWDTEENEPSTAETETTATAKTELVAA